MESPALPRPHRWGVPLLSYLLPTSSPARWPNGLAPNTRKIKAFLVLIGLPPEKSETKSGKSKGYLGNRCLKAGTNGPDIRTGGAL